MLSISTLKVSKWLNKKLTSLKICFAHHFLLFILTQLLFFALTSADVPFPPILITYSCIYIITHVYLQLTTLPIWVHIYDHIWELLWIYSFYMCSFCTFLLQNFNIRAIYESPCPFFFKMCNNIIIKYTKKIIINKQTQYTHLTQTCCIFNTIMT